MVRPESGEVLLDAMEEMILVALAGIRAPIVLDVGVGTGKVGRLVRQCAPTASLLGLESHAPFVAEAPPDYGRVFHGDLVDLVHGKPEAQHLQALWPVDLVTFGDVLEHVPWAEALNAVHYVMDRCRYALVRWPTGYLQESTPDCSGWAHRCTLTLADFTRFDVAAYRSTELDWPTGKMHVLLLRGVRGSRHYDGGGDAR